MTTFQLDERVLVDFFGDGKAYPGEIDAIDFEGDPKYPYRVWYDTPRPDDFFPGEFIEGEWVRESMLTRREERSTTCN